MDAWPYLTRDVPPAGGVLKQRPEDFEVEELPAYLPSGEGEHLFLWVEKRGVSTADLATDLARQLGIDEREVGYAGLKDRHALTRQFLSVPARLEEKARAYTREGVRVLRAARHGNKLRTGHLDGNRFRLRLAEVRDLDAAAAAWAELVARGVPNYFGEQRFGTAGDNARFGKLLLLGQRLPRRPSRFQRKLFLSAFQSLLFNRALGARLEAGTWARALQGDVLRKHDSGGAFVCEQPEEDQPRVDRLEVSPAGPLFGPKMLRAAGEVARAEDALLEEEGVRWEDLARGGDETQGARRAYRVLLQAPSLSRDEDALVLEFSLPAGAYATCVVRELVKGDARPS